MFDTTLMRHHLSQLSKTFVIRGKEKKKLQKVKYACMFYCFTKGFSCNYDSNGLAIPGVLCTLLIVMEWDILRVEAACDCFVVRRNLAGIGCVSGPKIGLPRGVVW